MVEGIEIEGSAREHIDEKESYSQKGAF